MNLSHFSIKRPVTILMLSLAVLIFGFISLPRLAVELYPEMNLPVAVVVTSVNGSAPAEVEKQVTKPMEEALGTVPNVKRIQSISIEGASQVIIEFNWGTDMDQAALDMRDKVDQVRGILPDNAKQPRVLKLDPNSFPIMMFALTGDQDVVKLKQIAEEVIKPRLERIDGVASVGVSGGRDRVVEVVLDPAKLTAYGLTLDRIQQAISATNLSGSGGSVQEGTSKLNIRVQGEYQSVEAIRNTPIPAGAGTIPLSHLAEVNDTYEKAVQLAYLDGQPSVGLSITKSSGGNTVEVADAVNAALAELQSKLPEGIRLSMVMDSSQFIKDSIYTMGEHAMVGGIFSIIILYLFLGSFRSMLIVAIVIPISLVATFSLMYFTGQTINMLSLAGLTLGLGSLVDFAVVILENIFRHRQEGKSMLQAARVGSREVGTAVMASALAQIVVFLPMVFVEGLASELFGPMALAVVYSHVAALLASICLVPVMSSRWLSRVRDHSELAPEGYRGKNPAIWFNIGFAKVTKGYGHLLRWSLGHRKTVLAVTAGLFVGAIALTPLVGGEFIPAMDQGKITVSIQMPNGTMFEETAEVTAEVEEIVKQVPELKQLYTSIGNNGGPQLLAASVANRAQLELTLTDKEERTRSTAEVVEDLRGKLASVAGPEITVKELDQSGGMTASPLQLTLHGDDLTVLEDISSVLLEEIKAIPGTRNVESSLDEKQREVQVLVDEEKAGQYGLTTAQIITAVRTAFFGQTVTQYSTGEEQIDVVVKLPESYQEEIGHLERLRLTTPTGAQVALSAVAEIVKEEVPQAIRRANQTRQVTITSDISGRDLVSVSRDVQAVLNELSLPDGYYIEFGGESKEMAEAFGSLGLALVLSIVLVYMVMASQFESLYSPFIIMFSVPPTFIGVVLGLVVTGHSLSVPALTGYILLVGIVVNNAIVLIDYVNLLRRKGMELREALIEAGPLRLRPILMTTLTTTLAITPLAFGGGAGNESQAPMAVVVIFGLSFSTLITLILVPVVYTLFDDWGKKLRRFRQRKRQQTNVPEQETPTMA